MTREMLIIGGGPAGLAAAWSAYQQGVRDIVIIERDLELGGILNQCIHNGFGLQRFQEELTGPEYAQRYITMLQDTQVQVLTDTMVIHLTGNKEVHCISAERGYEILSAKAIVLAMGCRERTRGAISLPGARVSGVFTAGAAQRYINMEGYMVGERIVILGSGDIGLIMARRMTLEGAKVLAVVELMPYSNGLSRNLVQCLQDFDIPLYLSHTVTNIEGEGRLDKVVVSAVDENRNPIPGTEMVINCDTLLLSIGLIPENELSREAGIALDPGTGGPVVFENMETSIAGIFACGNVLHVHDLVDYVSKEGEKAGKSAARYLSGQRKADVDYAVTAEDGINCIVPQRIRDLSQDIELMFRVSSVMERKFVSVYCGDRRVFRSRHNHLLPAEMEKICLSSLMMRNIDGDISVRVEDE